MLASVLLVWPGMFGLFVRFNLIAAVLISTVYGVDSRAQMCGDLFSGKVSSSIYDLLDRDFSLQKITDYPGNMPKSELTKMINWANSKIQGGSLSFKTAEDPKAPEHVIYNWMAADINYRTATKGIHKNDLKNLFNKSNYAHIGIYGMSDPASASFFGELLIEIAIYQKKFPLGDGTWAKTKDWQFGVDGSGQGGKGNSLMLGSSREFKTESYVVQDLRVIKAIRWPDKHLILSAWRSFDKELGIGKQEIEPLIDQWLMTPNYSMQERRSIIQENNGKFLAYLNSKGKEFWYPEVSTDGLSVTARALRLAGVLETVLGSEAQLVNKATGVIDYKKSTLAFLSLAKEQQQIVRSLAVGLNKSRLKFVLEILSAPNKTTRIQARQNLLKHIEKIKTFYTDYLQFDNTILQAEIEQINLI